MCGACVVLASCEAGPQSWQPPPHGVGFDYQIGGDYPLPPGVGIVTRDWFAGGSAFGAYSICYVNAFQTQPDERDVDRPDETEHWPPDLMLATVPDDPDWEGERLIDLSTPERRRRAAAWVAPMIDRCASAGFDAVELDNLDSYTRFGALPFGQDEAVAYAELLADHAHRSGLAVGQKNTPELAEGTSRALIGFDFAVAEECGAHDECDDYVAVFGRDVLVVAYDDADLTAACAATEGLVAVVRRDVGLVPAGEPGYVRATC